MPMILYTKEEVDKIMDENNNARFELSKLLAFAKTGHCAANTNLGGNGEGYCNNCPSRTYCPYGEEWLSK